MAAEPKKAPTREEMETKLLPKYTNAVKFALKVLDEAFIQEAPEAAPGNLPSLPSKTIRTNQPTKMLS